MDGRGICRLSCREMRSDWERIASLGVCATATDGILAKRQSGFTRVVIYWRGRCRQLWWRQRFIEMILAVIASHDGLVGGLGRPGSVSVSAPRLTRRMMFFSGSHCNTPKGKASCKDKSERPVSREQKRGTVGR